MLTAKNKVIIYAQDAFGFETAKTAIGFIKYGQSQTVAIVDRRLVNKTANEIVSGLPKIPIFGSIDEAKKSNNDADVLLLGIAPAGGRLPPDWLSDIKKAINYKLNIVNGLHEFLSNNVEITNLSKEKNVFIWDVRKTNHKFQIANAQLLDYPLQIVLTVGTDASVGKMTVALELTKSANLIGKSAKFIATGQTGIMISGSGIPLDAVVADFMAGAIEEEIIKEAKKNYEIIFVEGQGSILHPAWSGVTLALLHGSLPHKLILCHKVGSKQLRNTKIEISSLNDFIKVYENISLPVRKAKVVGIGLNTYSLSEAQAKESIKIVESETGLPVDDPIKFTGAKLLKVCLK